ncbi:winged helix DNA-binding domain-containing protein [Streptomyces caniferus]|uniref:DNA glycosylase AlkZ-like family protein n=1 Tax=Streptomyces caniferus TaxID=285557 RepID=UPI002E2843BC|nr:crosslink repair DNA glycosylase YcaQ family protein [Streptomyces caniferus]
MSRARPRPRIDTAGRRARLGRRQLLAPAYRADRAEEVADAVVALHASDPATVHLAACARLTAPDPAGVERALYDDGSLVRLLCMRRTLFAVGAALTPVVASSTAQAIAAKERAGMVKWITEGAPGWDERRLAEVEARTLAALRAHGEATAAELAAEVPDLRDTIVVSPGKPYQATVAVSSRILRVLAAEGRIRRGRPRGGWTSSSFRWRPGTAFAELPAPPAPEARAALARHWLAAYGPATVEDLKWWTGWTLTATRQALAALDAVDVDLDDGIGGVALPDDLEPVAAPAPWAALLPGLDPTAMGWKARDWYLDPHHVPQLFDRSGNIGPTVWWCGRIIGGWAQRADGEIVWRLLAEGGGTSPSERSRESGGGSEAAAAVTAEAARLAAWLGDVRVTPRFRTPLERELSA